MRSASRSIWDPAFTQPITYIAWKFNKSFAAEYYKKTGIMGYRNPFKGRAELDTNTASLTIRDLRTTDRGVFTVAINEKEIPASYHIVVVRRLDDYPVQVTVRPRGCSSQTSRTCTLVCGENFADAEPVQYFWKKENQQWTEGNKTITVSVFNNTQSFPRYTCKVKNLFSEKESDPTADPFRKPSSCGPGPGPGPGPRTALLLLALLAAGPALTV
ncbi:SLAM family member 5-like [Poeciliopsis prolifica]|uniref:SLAM family member 5-like n=1 Tax=Poeciliopsis prolifica TaxID=188132 RepID=UPI00241459DF|nr:SLAM family member 5-like [Poeciliopsis prolifica]